MTTTQSKQYKVTFVLDVRGTQESPEDIASRLKETMQSLGAEVSATDDKGILETARASQKTGLTSAAYLCFDITAQKDFAVTIREKLRLDKTIDRIFIESA